MSNANPVATVFEFQRTAIEQSQQVTREAVEAQKAAVGAFVEGVETAEAINEQNARLTRQALHAYFDAVEGATPEEAEVDFEQFRDLVDEQFDAATEARAETWEAIEEATAEGADGFEQFADNYVEALDEQFDSVLEAHEEFEANATDVAEDIDVSAN